MKNLKFTFYVILFSIAANAQSTFRINYDVAAFDIPVNTTEALTSNNYILSGFHANFIPFRSSLSQIDANGNIVWARQYSDASLAFTFGDFKRDVALNRYYVCGGSDSGPAFLMFVDQNGNLVSGRRFSISQSSGAFFNKVVKTSDGGYVCVGYVTGYDPDGAGGEAQFSSVTNNNASCSQSSTEIITSPLIVKFDANGVHQWHRVFRYYVGSVTIANRIYNDASFVDVVEVSDGIIAIGNYDVNNVFSTFNSDCEDTTPTDAMILKVDNTGTILWHRQIDNPSNNTSQSSKSFASISKTAAGLPLISGSDNTGGTTRPCFLMRLPGSGITWSNPTWTRRVGGALLIPFLGPYQPLIPSRFFETSDGQYAAWANYLPIPTFSNLLFKINPTTNAITWSRQHTFNLASLLPVGEEASDGGFIGLSYTLAGSGHDLHFIKTDNLGNAPATCSATTVNLTTDGPTYTWADPIYQSWNANTVTNTVITPVVSTITPNRAVQCIETVCTPPPAPTSVLANPNPICSGQSTTITATGGGAGNTYSVFANPSGGTSLGATPYIVSPTVTTTYYVQTVLGTDPNCLSTSRTPVTVTVTPLNTTTGPINRTICVNALLNPVISHTITGATGIGAPTGLPTGLNASFGSNTITISGTPTTTGTFIYTIPLTGGCGTVSATGTITVISINTVTGPFTNTICLNTSVSPTINHITGGATGIGVPSGLPPGVTVAWNSNTIAISGTPTLTGTYNYTIPLTGGCGLVNATGTIVVTPTQTVSAASNNPTVCINSNLLPNVTHTTFAASGIGSPVGLPAGVTAVWNANTITISGTPTVSGVFNYTIPLSGNCGTVSATGTITVNPNNTVSAASNSPTICLSNSITPITHTTSGATGIGTPIGLPNGVTASWNSNTITINGTPTSAGTFNYTIPLTAGCGTVNATGVIVVNATPTIGISSISSNSICEGESVVITPNGGAINNYTLMPGSLTGSSFTVTPNITTTYTISGTSNDGCLSTSLSNLITTISVNYTPTISLSTSVNDGTLTCNQTSITITPTINPITNTTYTWTSSTGLGITTPTNQAIATFTAPGVYTLTAQNNGCFTNNLSSINTFTVYQSVQNPTISLISTSSNTFIGCSSTNSTVSYSVNVNHTGAVNYTWFPGGQTSANISLNSPGSYTVVVTDPVSNCSSSIPFTVVANTITPQNPNAGTDGFILCGANTTTLSGSSTSSNVTFSWTGPSPSSIISGSNTSNPIVNEIGIYTLTITDNLTGCSATSTVSISQSTVIAGFTADTLSGFEPTTINFTNQSVGASTFSWNFGDGNTSSLINPSHTFTVAGSYTVTLIASVGAFCNDTARVVIIIKPGLFIEIPNVFTPNGDGKNDIFTIKSSGIKEINLVIFNRWGIKLYEFTGPKASWDGISSNGEQITDGTYYFLVIAKGFDGKKIEKQGYLNLFR